MKKKPDPRPAPEIHCTYDELVKVKDLKPYPNNAREHPQEQIEALSALIAARGWRVPITVSNQSGYIVRGHGRRLAAIAMGLDDVPVDFQDYASPDDEKADRLADNKIPELSHWDFDAMAKDFTMEEITALSPSIGMTETELNNFMDAAHVPLTPTDAKAAALAAAKASKKTDVHDEAGFKKEMKAAVEPKMAIVPQYCEDYESFIIVCKNTIDEGYIRQCLGLSDLSASYVDSKILRPNILTVEQFKEKWESR